MCTFQDSITSASSFDPLDFILFTYNMKKLALSFSNPATQKSSPGLLFVKRFLYTIPDLINLNFRSSLQKSIFNSLSDLDNQPALGLTSQDNYDKLFFLSWNRTDIWKYRLIPWPSGYYSPLLIFLFLLHLLWAGSIGILIKSFNNKSVENMAYGITTYFHKILSIMHLN